VTTEAVIQPVPEADVDDHLQPDPLTESERQQLARDEDTILRHRDEGYVHLGRALKSICTGRLYRETHSTFDKYVQAKFRMARSTANRFIAAAEVVEALRQAATAAGVANVATPKAGTIRPLTELPASERGPVFDRVISYLQGGHRLTARWIHMAIFDAAPQSHGRRLTDPAQRKLNDEHLEHLVHSLADEVAEAVDHDNGDLVVRRLRVLLKRRAR
jgi:hypothetical protein